LENAGVAVWIDWQQAIAHVRGTGIMDAEGLLSDGARKPSARDHAEALALRAAICAAQALGPVAASNLGGYVVRTIGPRLAESKIADADLRLAMPELGPRARRQVLLGVWENLGRTAAEMPHVGALQRTATGPGWECDDDSQLRALRDDGGPAIFFSGHLANWEIGHAVAASFSLSVSWFYRRANNPLANAVIQRMRRMAMRSNVPMFAKSRTGAREAMAHLRRGGLGHQKLTHSVMHSTA
jgi:KDO2-lipid IV(A) lauroyltransferase